MSQCVEAWMEADLEDEIEFYARCPWPARLLVQLSATVVVELCVRCHEETYADEDGEQGFVVVGTIDPNRRAHPGSREASGLMDNKRYKDDIRLAFVFGYFSGILTVMLGGIAMLVWWQPW